MATVAAGRSGGRTVATSKVACPLLSTVVAGCLGVRMVATSGVAGPLLIIVVAGCLDVCMIGGLLLARVVAIKVWLDVRAAATSEVACPLLAMVVAGCLAVRTAATSGVASPPLAMAVAGSRDVCRGSRAARHGVRCHRVSRRFGMGRWAGRVAAVTWAVRPRVVWLETGLLAVLWTNRRLTGPVRTAGLSRMVWIGGASASVVAIATCRSIPGTRGTGRRTVATRGAMVTSRGCHRGETDGTMKSS